MPDLNKYAKEVYPGVLAVQSEIMRHGRVMVLDLLKRGPATTREPVKATGQSQEEIRVNFLGMALVFYKIISLLRVRVGPWVCIDILSLVLIGSVTSTFEPAFAVFRL